MDKRYQILKFINDLLFQKIDNYTYTFKDMYIIQQLKKVAAI